MQTLALRKLLRLIRQKISPSPAKPSEATSELREESKVQDSEFEVQSEEYDVQDNEPLLVGEVAPQVTERSLSPADSGTLPEGEPTEIPSPAQNTKAHLTSSVPRSAKAPHGALTKAEMAEIREIFGKIDDAEIQRLYKRVTK